MDNKLKAIVIVNKYQDSANAALIVGKKELEYVLSKDADWGKENNDYPTVPIIVWIQDFQMAGRFFQASLTIEPVQKALQIQKN
jgi:hypothetical protein